MSLIQLPAVTTDLNWCVVFVCISCYEFLFCFIFCSLLVSFVKILLNCNIYTLCIQQIWLIEELKINQECIQIVLHPCVEWQTKRCLNFLTIKQLIKNAVYPSLTVKIFQYTRVQSRTLKTLVENRLLIIAPLEIFTQGSWQQQEPSTDMR